MKTQNLEIARIPFSSILKAEAAQLAKKTIGIVQNHDPETLLLESILGQLTALGPQIDIMSINYGVDPAIEKIENLKSKLMLTISKLKIEVKLLAKDGTDDELKTISNLVDSNLRKLYEARNEKVLTEKVNGFLTALENDEKFAEAIENKNLMSFIDGIKLVLREYKIALANRVTSLAERPKYDTELIVANVAKALDNVLKTIEVFHMTKPELDYTALIEELNQLARMYRRSINIRLANNRRKLERKKAEEDVNSDGSNDSDAPIEEDAPITTSYRTYMMEDEDDESVYADEYESSFEEDMDDEEDTITIE